MVLDMPRDLGRHLIITSSLLTILASLTPNLRINTCNYIPLLGCTDEIFLSSVEKVTATYIITVSIALLAILVLIRPKPDIVVGVDFKFLLALTLFILQFVAFTEVLKLEDATTSELVTGNIKIEVEMQAEKDIGFYLLLSAIVASASAIVYMIEDVYYRIIGT